MKRESNGDKSGKQERAGSGIFTDIKGKKGLIEKKTKETSECELKIKEEPLDVKIKEEPLDVEIKKEPRDEPEARCQEAEDEGRPQFYAFVNKDVRGQFIFIFYCALSR